MDTEFKLAISGFLGFAISILSGYFLLKSDWYLNKFSQPIRNIGKNHLNKQGTPTAGGLMIWLASLLPSIYLVDLQNPYMLLVIFIFTYSAGLGFYDDYLKIKNVNTKGVSGAYKFGMQVIMALIVCYVLVQLLSLNEVSALRVPFFKDLTIDIGYLYIPFCVLVLSGSSNAVNLTDGLDGLVTIPIVIVIAVFSFIIYICSDAGRAAYFGMRYIAGISELLIFNFAYIGAALGFLVYNKHPARVFMGDTGSMSAGALIGALALITGQELMLVITGGLFVIETLSVIVQVTYRKFTGGKKFFKMAPIHHHFEKLGWRETKIVTRFWIISFIFGLTSIFALYACAG